MIENNIGIVRARLAAACSKVSRLPGEITIVAVSKGRSSQEIKQALSAGISDIGENKVQEALSKFNELTGQRIKRHMIGHLQTNKVKDAVKTFDLIQSVDSLRLAAEIGRHAAALNKVQDILIEVKTSGEATKFGVKPDDAIEIARNIAQLKNISVKGLMTIAPVVVDPEQARPYFKLLKDLLDKINNLHITPYTLHDLSMGMSDDFEVAVEEGATMIRLGRLIFS